MKKWITFALVLCMLFPGMLAKAHTGLESSNPKEGEVVTESLEEVVLIFETEIESLSTMELFNSDQTGIPLNNLTVEGNTMKGDLNQELENGTYIIDWKIVGKDGHPIEGKVKFEVQLEQEEAVDETQEEEEQATEQQEKQAETSQDVKEENTKAAGNNLFPVLIIVMVIVLVASLLMLRKKK